jgi:hypothetical protein
MREFSDEEGKSWHLYQVSSEMFVHGRPDFLPPEYLGGWLVFESAGERRRLAPFPGEWATFSGEALRTLLKRANPARRRAGGPVWMIDAGLDRHTTDSSSGTATTV